MTPLPGLDYDVLESSERARLLDVNQPIEHASMEAALDASTRQAATISGKVIPVMVSSQGGRLMLTTAFTLATMAKHVRIRSTSKDGDVRRATNRPLDPQHVKTIKGYLTENTGEYICPPVTLNVRRIPAVHVAGSNASVRLGYMVIEDATTFMITDGQHRVAAIAGYENERGRHVDGVLDEESEFGRDAVAVQIVVEPSIIRIHQDFADAAQTKKIQASLLAVYNTREPINRVLARVVEETKLLRGRVDETSKTLPKLTQKLFLLNQVRQFLKALLFKDYALSDESMRNRAMEELATAEQQDRAIHLTVQLLNTLAEKMSPWSDISSVTPGTTISPERLARWRSDYVNMTATGLVVIGYAGYRINQIDSEVDRLSKYNELATEVPWRRDAPLWQGNILTDGKIATNRGPVQAASRGVLKSIGLAPEELLDV